MPPATKTRIWPIRGFPGYLVGDDGSVWSLWKTRRRAEGGRGVESFISTRMKQMKLGNHRQGYSLVKLRKDGRYCTFLVHRLVLETFVGPCPEGMESLHGPDFNKKNNRLSNLRWGTHSDNMQDRREDGTYLNATLAAALVNRGRKRSQEFRDKLSAAKSGKPLSAEHVQAIKDAHWSRGPNAEEVGARMAESLTGRTLTEEHKKAIADGLANSDKRVGRPPTVLEE